MRRRSVGVFGLLAVSLRSAFAFAPSSFGTNHHSRSNDSRIRLAARSSGDVGSEVDLATRKARIILPLSTATAIVLGQPNAASAGVGTPIPFEISLKEYFSGSLSNSIASLRISAALRKKRKYSVKTTVVVGAATCPDDTTNFKDTLAGYLSKDLATGGLKGADAAVVSIDCNVGGVPVDLKKSLAELGSRGEGKVVIVYGPHVGISKDGAVGYVERSREEYEGQPSRDCPADVKDGSDAKTIVAGTKQAYKTIREKVESQVAAAFPADNGVSELTLVGGITINRSKFGKDKDKGEDCFYPLSLKTLTSKGETIDLYDGAFGDMGIN